MPRLVKRAVAVLLLGVVGAAVHSGSALAVIVFEQSGLEAHGRLLNPVSGPPISTMTETEITLPFTRSVVSVADAQPTAFGSFAYSSSADIGNLALRVNGSLTNTGTSQLLHPSFQPLMVVSAQALDVLTLNSSLPGSFNVTLNLTVNGSIDSANGSAGANSLLSFGTDPGVNQTVARTYGNGPIADTLSITQTVSGPVVNMDFNAFLSFSATAVNPGATVNGELSNTAFLSLVLPTGVTLANSGSGTFGVVIAPIPEPEIYAMMLVGLGLVGFAARRKDQARRALAATSGPQAFAA
jgi:hypothetical protein